MPVLPVKIPQTLARLPGEWLCVTGAYLLVAVVTLWPLATALGSRLTGPFGDPLLNAWILAWDAERLLHGLQDWWQAPQFFPASDTLAWSEHLLGIAVFTAPVYWVTGNAVLAYNLAVIGSVVLAGTGTYLLTRELTGRRDAAFLAGLAYACLPYRAAQITHLQVLVNGWMPIALWGLHRYFRRRDRRGLAVFVVAYLLQALSNGYFLFFLVVPATVVCGAEFICCLRRTGIRAAAPIARDLAVAGLVMLLALSPVALAYLRARSDHGLVRSRGDMVQYSATPASYVSVPVSTPMWRRALPVGKPERELFPGVLLAAVALVGLAASRRERPWATDSGSLGTTAVTYATVTLFGFALTLGPEPALAPGWRFETGPWDWLAAALPGFDGLRVPARFAVVVYLGLSVLAGLGIARLSSSVVGSWRWLLIGVVGAGFVAEGWSAPLTLRRFPTSGMAVERAAYEWLATRAHGPMVELPVGDTAEGTRYLYWTLTHGNRIVNGYSGYGWPLEFFIGGPPSTEPDQAGELVRLGRALGLRYIVLHEHLYGDQRQGEEMARAIAQEAGQLMDARSFGTTWVFSLKPMPWSRPAPHGRPITDALRLSASRNASALPLMSDGDPQTRWLSGPPQDGTEWIEVRLDHPRRLTFLRLEYARRSFSDYPRALDVAITAADGSVRTVFSGGVVAELGTSIAAGDQPPGIGIALPGVETTEVRLRQTGRTARQWYWSIHELRLWEQP